MSRLRSTQGFSFVSLIVSLLILFLLMTVYLREFTSKNEKGGPAVTAIDATRARAKQVEEKQQEEKQQMDDALR
jgi:competence protein ComGC